MNETLAVIPVINLAFAFAPVGAVAFVLWRWSAGSGAAIYATARMIVQLALIGYVLTYVFETDSAGIVIAVLAIMLGASSWIALRPLESHGRGLYLKTLLAIAIGGVLTLAIVTIGVLRLDPWFAPRTVIPIAGMIFSSAMNTVSLAAERFEAERRNAVSYELARKRALETALIPMVNVFLAVGLVSLPGMMTGQILSGVDPQIAVRYQIMVMCMTFGAAGIAAIAYLLFMKPHE